MSLIHYPKHELLTNSNLDVNQYTISLLKECLRTGRMSTDEAKKIQIDTMYILKELITKYTEGESSSIKTAIAESFLTSIYYTLDFALLKCKHHEEAVSLIKTLSIKDVYLKGVRLIKSSVKKTNVLYAELKLHMLDVPFEIYTDTINKGIPDFFSDYDPLFYAHETMSSMDYPIIFDDTNRSGIDYMKQYIENLTTENQFCNFFTIDDIVSLMENYGWLYNMNIKNSPINIFEVVINNSIFSTLLGRDSNELIISKEEFAYLQDKLCNLQEEELTTQIDNAIGRMILELSIDQENLLSYIARFKQQLIPRIIKASKAQNYQYLIIFNGIDKYVKSGYSSFENGVKVDDDSFRRIIKNILACENTSDKIGIIKTQLNSLEDVVDALEADCLFDFEYLSLYSVLSDVELSVLGKIVFSEDLRNGPICLLAVNLDHSNTENIWKEHFIDFIQSLTTQRIDAIEKWINILE
ncbi:MAG: hypothetical protein CVU84_12595 [Firmicutes bacterium HGW-Firmicutes-1]|jgi:hypothetical protein|nr:MAG: hypothetical protein CVU84_12595 [Firmicutes bacterium HGW-Firmicutes-1]